MQEAAAHDSAPAAFVGEAVGDAVGKTVGIAVGKAVGVAVGTGVGAGDSPAELHPNVSTHSRQTAIGCFFM